MFYLLALLLLSPVQDISATKYMFSRHAPCGCSRRPILKARIVGGQSASSDNWSWAVSLRDGNSHFCGGSILNERFVITAAHCLANANNLSSITVCAGTTHLSSSCRQLREIQNVIKHPSFNGTTYENDIALIEVKIPFNFSDLLIARICLPDINQVSEYPKPGTNVTAVGWGTTETNKQPDMLQKVTIKIVDKSTNSCNSILFNNSLQLCAGASGKDTCQGDGGGPLMVFTESKRWELIGITSYGYDCATEFPGVYTRITAFLQWIHQSFNHANRNKYISDWMNNRKNGLRRPYFHRPSSS